MGITKSRRQLDRDTLAALVLFASNSSGKSVLLPLFGRAKLFELAKLLVPTLGRFQPKCAVLMIGRMPCQFSAFFDLLLSKFFSVERD